MNTFEVLEVAQARLEQKVSGALFVIGDKKVAPTPNRVVTGRVYLESVRTVGVDASTREREIRVGIALEVLSQQANLGLTLLEQLHAALDVYEVPSQGRFEHLETRWVKATPTVWAYQLLFLFRRW